MSSRGVGVGRSSLNGLCASLIALFTHNAWGALPPSVGQATVPIAIPLLGDSIVINLRDIGAIDGSPPLLVDARQVQILTNGQPPGGLFVDQAGGVCVSITNLDFTPPTQPIDYSISVFVSNAITQASAFGVVPMANTAGPVVDTDEERAACADPNTPPIANAGPNRTISDVGTPGEVVTLNGSATDVDPGTEFTYEWRTGDTVLQSGQNPTFTTGTLLPGTYTFSLTVFDDSGDPNTNTSASSDVTITILANNAPTANAGEDQVLLDSDGQPGEGVELSGTASDSDGTIASFQWIFNDSTLGTTQTLTARLPDGVNEVQLLVTDNSGQQASDIVVITVGAPAAPTAQAGEDETIADSDGIGGEPVTLTGTGTDPDGDAVTYEWFLNDSSLGSGATLETRLPDGVNQVELVVTDSVGLSGSDVVVITVVGPAAPVANAGADQEIADTDNEAGENVTLDGSASGATGGIASYVWRDSQQQQIATGVTANVRLADGENIISLTVTNNAGVTATDTVSINIAAAPQMPLANAGADQTIADTDQQPGEVATLDGTASSDPNDDSLLYEWSLQAQQTVALGTGATLSVRLPDGTNTITLRVQDPDGNSATDTMTVTVLSAPQMPIANAGGDQTLADSDREPGEIVALSGAASSDPNGETLTFEWSLQADPVVALGTGPTLSVRLPDGANTVSLRVEDASGNFATDTATITVAAPAERVSLAELPGLTANKRSIATALDRICVELDESSRGESTLIGEQQAMLERCNALYFDNTAANQSQALEALGADDFAAARTQTLLFSNTLYASVMDRLVALRGGARGLSLAGLNIVLDGQFVPLAQLQDMAKGLLGGGASSDADEAGGLFSDKLGVWARGNYSLGEKDESSTSPRFEADQWALMGGIDYRLSEQAVIGLSVAYGQSGIEFDPQGEGALDTTSWAASMYGSLYAAKNFYFDAIANVASSDYDAKRNITYVDGSGLVDTDANGTTDGLTLSGGMSMGYDFLLGRFTLSPTLGVFYIDAAIDGFTESGAAGLNLIYDEQNFSSLTGNLGLRMTYSVNTNWGVLLPHIRVDYVREFEDDVDVFGVRFAADPNATSTPPILVQTDNPDRSYWRLATGFSAQFAQGFSGYVEYQRLESFEFISFEDLSLGLRMQKSF